MSTGDFPITELFPVQALAATAYMNLALTGASANNRMRWGIRADSPQEPSMKETSNVQPSWRGSAKLVRHEVTTVVCVGIA